MKRMNVILTDKQRKIIDAKFKEARILKAIIELSKFIIPTLKQVDAEVNTTTDISWIDAYTEEELYKILNS